MKEASEKLITTIASELDPEEPHQKEKSPWDMIASNDKEETYQTEGEIVYADSHIHLVLTRNRNPSCLDRNDQATPQGGSRSYPGLNMT